MLQVLNNFNQQFQQEYHGNILQIHYWKQHN